MHSLAPKFSVTREDRMREIHWTAVGLWEEKDAYQLYHELLAQSKPFRDDRKGFRVMGDLREFRVQKADIAEHMRNSQETSAQLGVDRMAIVYSSTLLKQQFRRISDALECQFLTDKDAALKWLRS
jgi:hypothetical protein